MLSVIVLMAIFVVLLIISLATKAKVLAIICGVLIFLPLFASFIYYMGFSPNTKYVVDVGGDNNLVFTDNFTQENQCVTLHGYYIVDNLWNVFYTKHNNDLLIGIPTGNGFQYKLRNSSNSDHQKIISKCK